MKRAFAGISATVILIGVVVASASALTVQSGALMVLSSMFEPPTPTPRGQAGTSIGAQKTAAGFWVSPAPVPPLAGARGDICVANEGDVATEGLRIIDVVQTHDGAGRYTDYVSLEVDVSAWPLLPPHESHCYPYEIQFAPVDGAQYRNVARVTITNHSGHLPGSQDCPGTNPCPFGPEPKADFTLPAPAIPLDPAPETPTPEATAETPSATSEPAP